MTSQSQIELDRLPEAVRDNVEQFAELLRGLGGANVQSLTVFGEVAVEAFDPQRHAVCNVLVLGSVDLKLLAKIADRGVHFGKQRIAAPLVMTPDYIKASLDTFPLELLEIRQHHVTVLGDDPFAALEFADAHVRHQCEREFKRILIALRQGLLGAAGREHVLEAMEMEVGEALVRTLRGVLWINNEREPLSADEIVSCAERVTGGALDGVRATMDPAAEHGWAAFERLYRDVERLAETVDAL